MLRTSNHIHGITHVIFGVIDVYWLMNVLYQNTDIDTSEKRYIYVLLYYIVVIYSSLRFRTIFSLLIHLSVHLDVSL